MGSRKLWNILPSVANLLVYNYYFGFKNTKYCKFYENVAYVYFGLQKYTILLCILQNLIYFRNTFKTNLELKLEINVELDRHRRTVSGGPGQYLTVDASRVAKYGTLYLYSYLKSFCQTKKCVQCRNYIKKYLLVFT